MSDTESLTVTREGLTLSGLLVRHYRAVIPGAIEQVWALNQDLARRGAELAVGTVLTVPVRSSFNDEEASTNVTGLFD